MTCGGDAQTSVGGVIVVEVISKNALACYKNGIIFRHHETTGSHEQFSWHLNLLCMLSMDFGRVRTINLLRAFTSA